MALKPSGPTTLTVRPTRVRYRMLGLVLIVTAINYLDRTVLSIAMPSIRTEFGLTGTEAGLILSAFSWAYVLCQIPGGWLLDRYGARIVYGISILSWSIATGAMALAGGFAGLFGLRIALGVAEAPSFPANNKLVTAWFPSSERARATAVYNSGNFIGLALFMPVLAWLVATYTWHVVFLLTGLVGVVISALWFRFARNKPADHPGVNAAETELTAADAAPQQPRRATWQDLRYLLRKRRMLGMYLAQFCTNGVMWFFLTWFPTYLVQEKGMSFVKAGFLASLPYLAALVGVLFSGTLSDWLLRSGRSRTFARKLPMMIGFAGSSLIILANYTDAPGLVITVMAVAFFAQGMSAIGWTLASEVAPVRMMGLSGGVFGFFTNLGGAIVPIVIGIILDATGSFNGALVFVGALGALGFLAFLVIIDRVERLDPDRPSTAEPARS
ncbi:MFS transporter [Pseudonocardia endophytica]|uniref:ACS family D-galactonate transporter-like MFS transporter n=1 Tax=Pseudonocardia endophytica TaxID=401976 RepID=A0A4R1HKC4_PSEEN|nr:MFS transporter [Pseudonocardia endophytica]TCK21481.1 ACS family D-galactonate transporter-like MFS transporter [Pseudonocardia endophytica]